MSVQHVVDARHYSCRCSICAIHTHTHTHHKPCTHTHTHTLHTTHTHIPHTGVVVCDSREPPSHATAHVEVGTGGNIFQQLCPVPNTFLHWPAVHRPRNCAGDLKSGWSLMSSPYTLPYCTLKFYTTSSLVPYSVRTHTHALTHTYAHAHIHSHTLSRTHTLTQHTRMYTHTHMYIHSHTHTHTHKCTCAGILHS